MRAEAADKDPAHAQLIDDLSREKAHLETQLKNFEREKEETSEKLDELEKRAGKAETALKKSEERRAKLNKQKE